MVFAADFIFLLLIGLFLVASHVVLIICSTWGYLTFLVFEYYISHARVHSQTYVDIYKCVCARIHRCTERVVGASMHGLRHIVLISSPISKETHPFPICCLPPMKIFLLFYNNSMQTFLQSESGWKRKSLFIETLEDSNSRVACRAPRLSWSWKVTVLWTPQHSSSQQQ